MQDHKASEGVVATLRIGRCNMGTQVHDAPPILYCLRMKVRGLVD